MTEPSAEGLGPLEYHSPVADARPLRVGRVVACVILLLCGAFVFAGGGFVLLFASVQFSGLGDSFAGLAAVGALLALLGVAVLFLGVKQGQRARS